jgi:hypothetical protein
MVAQYALVPFVAQAEQTKQSQQASAPGATAMSELFGQRLLEYLGPLVQHLHDVNKVDKRPLKTLVQTVEAILAFRDRCNGLLYSEWGAYLDQLGGSSGGVKRLETLIHQSKWKAQEIEEFLLWRADPQLEHWEEQGEEGLFIWDGVGLEKPESIKGEGLCPTRSGKAARLTHVKKG